MEAEIFAWKSPFGELLLGTLHDELLLCDWRYRKGREAVDQRLEIDTEQQLTQPNTLMQEVMRQITAYAGGSLQQFDVPLQLKGSEFQQNVWRKLLEIPYGSTMSYQQLSNSLGNPLAIRAVAAANGANAISIIVPCHRIIGTKGELTGYAGGLRVKEKLLRIENKAQGLQQRLFEDEG